jgi:hypothetical protein
MPQWLWPRHAKGKYGPLTGLEKPDGLAVGP